MISENYTQMIHKKLKKLLFFFKIYIYFYFYWIIYKSYWSKQSSETQATKSFKARRNVGICAKFLFSLVSFKSEKRCCIYHHIFLTTLTYFCFPLFWVHSRIIMRLTSTFCGNILRGELKKKMDLSAFIFNST